MIGIFFVGIIYSSTEMRNIGFNLYLVFLVIPDVLVNGIYGTIHMMLAFNNGTCTSRVICTIGMFFYFFTLSAISRSMPSLHTKYIITATILETDENCTAVPPPTLWANRNRVYFCVLECRLVCFGVFRFPLVPCARRERKYMSGCHWSR